MPKKPRRRKRRVDDWTEEDERHSQEAAKQFFDRLYCWYQLVTGNVDKARRHYNRNVRKR